MKKLLCLFVFGVLLNKNSIAMDLARKQFHDKQSDYKTGLHSISKELARNAAARTYAQQPHITSNDALSFLYRGRWKMCGDVLEKYEKRDAMGIFVGLKDDFDLPTVFKEHATCLQHKQSVYEEKLRDTNESIKIYEMIKAKIKKEN